MVLYGFVDGSLVGGCTSYRRVELDARRGERFWTATCETSGFRRDQKYFECFLVAAASAALSELDEVDDIRSIAKVFTSATRL